MEKLFIFKRMLFSLIILKRNSEKMRKKGFNAGAKRVFYCRDGNNDFFFVICLLSRTSVMWLHNQKEELPWNKVTSDGKLVLLHANQSAQGNYSCHSDEGSHLHSISLMLGRKCCCNLLKFASHNVVI